MLGVTMGEPVVVREKPSSKPGVVRFETNRLLTGMGHERYRAGDDVWGERPPDVLARRLLARGGVDGVQVHGNMVTVDIEKGYDAEGLASIIENMYVFYPDNMVGAHAPVEPHVADAPERVAVESELAPEPAVEEAPEPVAAEPEVVTPDTDLADPGEPTAGESEPDAG